MNRTAPHGNVTFLFTDTCGATRLAVALVDVNFRTQALSDHVALLTKTVTGNAGIVVQKTSDGVFAVFQHLRDGQEEATALQDALREQQFGYCGSGRRRHMTDKTIDKATLAVLRSVDALRALGEDELLVLAEIGTLLSADPGVTLLPEGQSGTDFYLICSGTAEVATHNVSLAKVPFQAGQPGEFFGELAALTDGVRSASVTAGGDQPLVLLKLNMADLPQLMQRCPNAMTRMTRELAYRLKRNAVQLRDYIPMSARDELSKRAKTMLTPTDLVLERLAAVFSQPLFLVVVIAGYVGWLLKVWHTSGATWLTGLGAVMTVLTFSISTLLLYYQRRMGTIKETLESVEYLANLNAAAKIQELSDAMAPIAPKVDDMQTRLDIIVSLLPRAAGSSAAVIMPETPVQVERVDLHQT